MNILILNYEYPPVGGGGGVVSRDLSEGLVERGHRVAVITSQFRDAPAFEQVNGVDVYRVPVLLRRQQDVASLPSMLSYVPLAVRLGRRFLSRESVDLIDTHFAVPTGPAGYFLSRRFGLPSVLHLMGGDVYDPSKLLSPHQFPLLKQTVRKMIRSADEVVSISSDVERNARRYYGTSRPIEIIPNPIRPNPYPPASRAGLGMDEDRFTLITVGRLVRRKNLPELLEIFANLNSRIPCELWIVGDGPEHAALEEQAAGLGVSDHVRFTGRVSDQRKFELLQAADVYVSTALHEGFGIVFLEAMECGLPVVCYDRGGQTDFLSDDATGYVVGFGERQIFEERCFGLRENPETRRGISRHNRTYVQNFYFDQVIARQLEVYRKAVGNR